VPSVPPAEFLDELAEAFGRLRPQGSARWNFAAAFTRLEGSFGAESGELADDADPLRSGEEPRAPAPGQSQRAVRRAADPIISRIQPWIEARAAEAASAATRQALAEGTARIDDGFDAAVEALRFLAARVEALEDAAARRTAPVEGPAWLVTPPELAEWVGPASGWLAGSPGGTVVHGECADGAFARALAGTGMAVRGCEPRGSLAWIAAARGLPVHLGPVPDYLAGLAAGSLSGLVLSGLVDRLALEEQVALAGLAADRLVRGGRVVVIGTLPGAGAGAPDAVARDLLPGRPLHPETWALLLARAGFSDVGRLGPPDGPGSDTFAVRGRWDH
jgi:hypothetical protein